MAVGGRCAPIGRAGPGRAGFSLDAAVRVGAHDRIGLERLLHYCARPTFALERLERLDDERVVYRLPKPQRDGTKALTLTPLELIDHLAALIPPPRRHRHRYHGVLATSRSISASPGSRRLSRRERCSPSLVCPLSSAGGTPPRRGTRHSTPRRAHLHRPNVRQPRSGALNASLCTQIR
ncbi:transposase [uncultured Thiohalocapsa sp.]|uniref:transposase n=1 Tax=uncultured Thiohalocapsa sp. TaxID=768990 RepID=UPI0025E0AA6B|nr:transposase [uncultured Thiohalocapsa sp.]